jgi:hemolysin activation/secretion protein
LSLLGSILDSNSNVTTVGSTNVVGKGQIVGLRLLDPLGLGEGFIHSLSAGFDYKDLTQQTGLAGQSTNVPIQYVPFTVGYQASWSGANAKTDLLANVVWAFPGIGSSAAQFDENRFDAPPNFIYLRGDLSRAQTLPYNIEAWGRLQTQLSPDALVSSEQFGLGGEDSVRGYLESEALGDYGATLQTELRTPPLAEYVGGSPVQSLRAYSFVDVGGAQIHNPLPGQIRSYSFSSAGVGVRLKVTDYLNGSLEDAQVMASGPNTKAGTNRILFRVYGEF